MCGNNHALTLRNNCSPVTNKVHRRTGNVKWHSYSAAISNISVQF